MGAMSLVLGCNLGGALGSARSGGCGSGKVGVGLLKWGLGYVSLGSLDVDRSSWWCAISPMLGCDEWVLVCDLRGASGGASSLMLMCDLAGARVRARRCWCAISVVLQVARAHQCWCAISPVLGCDLRGASDGTSSPVLVCNLSSLLFLSLFCFPGAELI